MLETESSLRKKIGFTVKVIWESYGKMQHKALKENRGVLIKHQGLAQMEAY